MKTYFYFILFIALFVVGFKIFPENNIEEIKDDIQGSWELVSYIDHPNNGKEWESHDNNIIYQKHITKNYFTWIQFDKKADQLLRMGGGSYKIDSKGRYIEHLDFFYPPGSSELGQSIPFNLEFKESKWYHSGKAKKMELGDDGSMVMVGYIKIEEIWSPIVPTFKNNYELIGSWNLKSYRDKLSDQYMEYPVFTGYMKILTPTHFVWIKYDKEGDQIFAAGSGPYVYDGIKYVEVLEMVYPSNSGQLNTQVKFKPSLDGQQWNHFGYAPVVLPDKKDSLLIDEVWIPKTPDEDDFSSTF